MRIDHLRFLVNVAETKSISRSAERLYISQQGLSQSICQLEKHFGVDLFTRTANKIYLNAIGEKIVERSKKILLEYDELQTELKTYLVNNSIETTKTLTVYSTSLICETILTKIVNRFSAKHPSVNLTIFEKEPIEILNDLKSCKDSIVLLNLPDFVFDLPQSPTTEIGFEKLGECELQVIVGKSSPLVGRKSVSAIELLNYPIAVFDFEQFHEIINKLFENIGKPKILLNTTNSALYRQTVASGLAVGFKLSLNNEIVKNKIVKKNLLVTLPLDNPIKLIIGWINFSELTTNSLVDDLIKMIKQYFISSNG